MTAFHNHANPLPSLPPGTNLHEWWAAEEWYNNLTYAQKDYLLQYYYPMIVQSHPLPATAILRAYRERDITHAASDWPIHPMRQI